MEWSAELARLEEFVDTLLTRYNQLQSECQTLQEALRQRDAECAELKTRVHDLSVEQSAVGNKVAGLMGRIEEWEHGQTPVMAESNDRQSESPESLSPDGSAGTVD